MRISGSSITFVASHHAEEEYLREESLQAWVGPRPGGDGGPLLSASRPGGDQVRLSAVALVAQAKTQSAAAQEPSLETEVAEDPKLRVMRHIIEALTGHKIKVSTFEQHEAAAPTPVPAPAPSDAPQAPVAQAGWGIDYTLHERFREEETTRFAATGRVATADGREVDFRLELIMHREFTAETLFRLQAGDAVLTDPLVVNFAGNAAELEDGFFAFDLDRDGQAESVSLLKPGSGFLVFDRNADGIINDGGELFGPATGNGFAELAGHDLDGNGWLDENDPDFEKLAVWWRSGAGHENLSSLRDFDIGALLLEPTATPFSLKNATNTQLGQVRETSLFVRNDGSIGTVQEIDLVA